MILTAIAGGAATIASRVAEVVDGGSAAIGVPSGPSPKALALQATIAAAQNDSTIRITPGEYVFSNTSLKITSAHGLELDGTDVNLIFYYGFGVKISDSANCTFTGFTLDSDPPNYAQGTVVSTSGSSFIADFDPAFIPPMGGPFTNPGGLAGAKVAFWDAATKRMQPLGNQFMVNATKIGRNKFAVNLKSNVRGNMVAGDTPVTIFPRRGFTWQISNSYAINTQQVTIYAGGNMGFHESSGEGGHVYKRVAITRKPGSIGLLALNADGFHSDSVGLGPTLLDSEISFTGDDFLNIHNRMQVICKKLGDDSLAVIDVSSLDGLGNGSTMTFWKLEPNCPHGCKTMNDQLGGTATVKSSTRVTDHGILAECEQAFAAMALPPYSAALVVHEPRPLVVHAVTFEEPLDAAVTATQYNLAQWEERSGAGAVVRRNHFHDGFSRMGLLKASDLTYADNVAERASGLHIFSEQEWLEGGLGITNIVFENNTVVDPTPCGILRLNASACFAAAEHFVQVMIGLKNVSCQDNTFEAAGVSQRATVWHPGYCHPAARPFLH